MVNRLLSFSLMALSCMAQGITDNPGGSSTPPITADVPEPGTWLMLATGAGALGLAKWWSNRKR